MTRSHPDMFQQTEWAGATGKPNGAAHENSVGKRRRRKVKGGLDELIIANADAAIEPDAAPPVEETTEPDANAAVDEDDLIKDPDARRAVGDCINAMRAADNALGRLLAIRACSRRLEPDAHHDAFAHLTSVGRDIFDLEVDAIQAAFDHGQRLRENDLADLARDDFAADDPLPDEPSDSPGARKSFRWTDMSTWDTDPVPERKWAIKSRVPLNQAGLFSGEGGTGKSIIELMKNVAHVAGKDWLGSLPEQGPAFYIGAEDDKDEIHIRLADIAGHYGVTFEELIKGGLKVLCLLGQDATLCALGKGGRIEVTALYRQLYEAAGDLKPKNISIDTLSRASAGNEIDRVQVYAFSQYMQALAMVAGGSVTVLSHPSLQGINTGTGLSGSTAWHGAFRFRQYLKGAKAGEGEQPDNDLRELEFKKNQYGPKGETIVLRYQRGLFLPEVGLSGLDKLAREATVDDAFMRCLDEVFSQGRHVGPNPGKNYAPTMFEKMPCANQATKSELAGAMERLLRVKTIRVEITGSDSRPRQRIVRSVA